MTEVPLVHSPWHRDPIPVRHPVLEGELRADVVVIGGGISGLSTAWHLARRGIEVVLLEQGAIGSQSSTRNYGIIDDDWDLDDPDPQVRLAQARYLRGCAPRLKAIIDAEGIDCSYAEGVRLWRLARNQAQAAQGRKTAAALAGLGYNAGFADGPQIPVTTEQVPGALWLEQAEVDPARLIEGLRSAIERLGVRIFESTPVARAIDGLRFRAETARGAVDARVGVIAANGFSADLAPTAGLAMPAQIFSLATRPLPPEVAATIGPAGGDSVLDIDDARPFTQRFMRDGRLWFGAGIVTIPGAGDMTVPHLTQRVADAIVGEMVARYPALSADDVEFWWGGTLCRTAREKPLIGRLPGSGSAYAAIVCHGKGMALGSSAGAILAELIAPSGTGSPDPDMTAFLSYCEPPRRRLRGVETVLHRVLRGTPLRSIANRFLGA